MSAEGIVVRDSGVIGFGLQHHPSTGKMSTGVLRGSVIERSNWAGVLITSPDTTVDGCVVRGHPQPTLGLGIHLQGAQGYQTRASVTASVVERVNGAGISVQGADATIEGCVVREVQELNVAPPREGYAAGVEVRYDPFAHMRANAVIRATVVEDNLHTGIEVRAATASITNTAIRRTKKSVLSGSFGDGIAVQSDRRRPSEVTSAQISGCAVEGSDRSGIANFGATVAVDTSALHCNRFALDAEQVNDMSASFEDNGENTCACGDTQEPCKAQSSRLEAPEPFDVER